MKQNDLGNYLQVYTSLKMPNFANNIFKFDFTKHFVNFSVYSYMDKMRKKIAKRCTKEFFLGAGSVLRVSGSYRREYTRIKTEGNEVEVAYKCPYFIRHDRHSLNDQFAKVGDYIAIALENSNVIHERPTTRRGKTRQTTTTHYSCYKLGR